MQTAACSFSEIRHIHINSWDQNCNDISYLKGFTLCKDLCVFLQSVGYDNTISVEAFDADFPETGLPRYLI